MKVSDLGERGFLELVRAWTSDSSPRVILGVGDDAAILPPSGDREIIVSTDAFLEGVHFTRPLFSPDDIGHKVMAATLSDLAAMGAEPWAAFVDLFAPGDSSVEFLRAVYAGMERVAGACGARIAGGDTVAGPLAFGITVIGTAPRGGAWRRDGARAGDVIYVSGELGKSEAGRLLLTKESALELPGPMKESATRAHLNPVPRFDVVQHLRALTTRRVDLERETEEETPVPPTAMIDVSDGLGIDLVRLCEASGVGCRVEEARIPVNGAARQIALDRDGRASDLAMSGGEDFELLFTMRPDDRETLEASVKKNRLDVRAIGLLTSPEEGRVLVRDGGALVPWQARGYEHFRSGAD
jgi:thiamine-monophosphate kinase